MSGQTRCDCAKIPSKLILGVGALREAPWFRAVHEPPLHDPDYFLVKFLVLRHFPQVCRCIYLAHFCTEANLRGTPLKLGFLKSSQPKSGCDRTPLTIQLWGPPHPGRRSRWNHSEQEILEERRMRNRGLVRQCCSSGTCEQGSPFEARR
jgi:hypothetical protein